MTEPNKELPKYAPIIEAKDKEIAVLEATNHKIIGLLKDYVRLDYDVMVEHMKSAKVAAPSFKWYLWNYCKENGIDLGGE